MNLNKREKMNVILQYVKKLKCSHTRSPKCVAYLSYIDGIHVCIYQEEGRQETL